MAIEWTQLPQDLIEAISKHLNSYTDYLTLRAICPTWRATLPKTPHHNLPPQLPYLLTTTPQHRLTFYNLSTHKTHSPSNLPTMLSKRCRFSSHGYLIFLDENPNILVLNPLTCLKLALPPLTAFANVVVGFSFNNVGREYVVRDRVNGVYTLDLRQMRDLFIKKVVFSCSPVNCGDGFVVMVVLGGCGSLGYWRNGESCWRVVDDVGLFCEDVVYHNGLFYAVDKFGVLVVCDVSGGKCSVSVIDTPRLFCGDLQYLVSSGDDLLLVTRVLSVVDSAFSDRMVYRTTKFEVFRLDMKQRVRWEAVRSLGDDKMLFVGGNSSLALSASDYRWTVGDSIYYTDDYSESNSDGVYGENDSGIYKLCDGSIELLPCFSAYSHYGHRWPSPLWVSPNPW